MPRSNLNQIVISCPTRDGFKYLEGIIKAGETPKPGTCVQIDADGIMVGGRHVWEQYNRGADGNRPAGPHIILVEDQLQGKLVTDAYVAGSRAFGHVPLPGDELHLLFHNQSGTGDDIAAGDLLIVDDGTGKFIKTSGAPEMEPAMALEAYTDPTEDRLLWCIWC